MMALTSVQTHALFDCLTHQQAYKEVHNLDHLDTITHFGRPLDDNNETSSSPLIQSLLVRFMLVLPGLQDVPPDFWQRKIKELFAALSKADLSESYDKGSIGIRRTLATACAAMVEYCARGSLGGYAKRKVSKQEHTWDSANPRDVAQAWDEFLQQIVHGDLLDRMFQKAASTDQLTDHEPLVRATQEHVLVMCEVSST